MPIIYTYPKVTPANEDLVLISDASATNPAKATRQCTISDILALGTGEDYDLNAGAKVGTYIPLNLTSTSGTDNSFVQLTEGTSITLTRNSATQITIDAEPAGVSSVTTANNLGASSGIGFVASPNPIIGIGTITTSFAGTIGDVLYADTATSLAKLSAGTATHVLTSNGAGVAPSWQVNPTAPVSSVSAITPGSSGGTPIVVTPTTGAVEIQSMAFNGDGNVGHVPDASAAAATSYLKMDGSWSTPPDTTYSVMTDTVLGLGKVEDNTTQTTAANTVTTTASRTYGVQKNSADQLVVNVPWTDTGATSGGWDILNFAQAETFSDNLEITYFYQVVVPENFTANKAKIFVSVAGGASTFVVAIYDGVLSNLAATTKLGDGTVNPSSGGIVEVPLSPVSAGDLDLTKGQNVIVGFAQTLGDKLACISGRLVNADFAISATGIPPTPSNLNGLEESGTSALRPCCVLYQ